eukprot:1401167-Pyramimonas_sp.AAC.2
MYRIVQARQLACGPTFLTAPPFCCPFEDSSCGACCTGAAGPRRVSLPPDSKVSWGAYGAEANACPRPRGSSGRPPRSDYTSAR